MDQYGKDIFLQLPNAYAVLSIDDVPRMLELSNYYKFRVFPYKSKKDIVGKGIETLFTNLLESQILNDMFNRINRLKTDLTPSDVKLINISAYNASVWVESQFLPVLDENENLIYILHKLEDVSERVKIESSLKLVSQALDHTFDSLNELTKALPFGPSSLTFSYNDTAQRDLEVEND